MKKKTMKSELKLKLHRETLRALEAPELKDVAGASLAHTGCPTQCATACQFC